MGSAVSLTETAYAAIKASILNGDIPPNTQIDELATASRLGMSRTPVREALLKLRSDGLVEMARGRGIHVRLLSSADMRDLYELITAIETLAAFLITTRRPAEHDIAALIEATNRMEEAGRHDDVEGWGRADEAFHRGLLTLCGNARATRTGLEYRDTIQRAHLVAMRLQPRDYLAQSATSHRELVAAMLSHDAEHASNLHSRQRRRGQAALMAVIEQFGLAAL